MKNMTSTHKTLVAYTAIISQISVSLAAQGAGCMYTVNNNQHVCTDVCDHCVQETDRLSQQMQTLVCSGRGFGCLQI